MTHLAEAGRLGALRGLLALATAEGRNAWYEAKLAAGALGAYVVDVAAALRAVQALPPGSVATVPRLGDHYLYALSLTSANSLSAAVPPALLGELVRDGLVSTSDALSYARRATDAIRRAEALIDLLPMLNEAQCQGVTDEVVREIEASARDVALAEQSSSAKLLARLAEHVAPPEVLGIVDSLIDSSRMRIATAAAARARTATSTPSPPSAVS